MITTDHVILQTDIVAPAHITTPISYAQWGTVLRTITKTVDMELHDQNRRGAAEALMHLAIMSISMLDDLGYHRKMRELSMDVLNEVSRHE